jgi:hypothetical protein
MPTYKEVSKIIDEFIAQRENQIKSKVSLMQNKLYEDVILDFLNKIKKSGEDFSYTDLVQLENRIKKFGVNGHPEVLQEIIDATKSMSNLNLLYFSTLIDSPEKLNDIKIKTEKLVNRKLGLDDKGRIKPGGFLDRMITDKWVQRTILKEARKALAGGFDFQSTREKFKQIIVGGPKESGVIQKHYTTFTNDLLSSVNNNNNNIYATELGLNYARYAGGLIKTSRSLCIKNNGKIFSRKQIEALKEDPFIIKMYGGNIDDYNPFELPGGYGCKHSWNWITDDYAVGLIREQNKKATEKNQKFKDRNGL